MGVRDLGLAFEVYVLGCGVVKGFGLQGLGFKVWGVGFRV